MFNILADTFKTAARQNDWDAPRHWRNPDEAPPERRTRDRDRQTMRRWLRSTGIL
jgi:hypothetical protein